MHQVVVTVIIFGGNDIGIAKLSPDGTALLGGTYVGGTGEDGFNTFYYNYGDTYRGEVNVDANNNIYRTVKLSTTI